MKKHFGWALASALLVGSIGSALAADMPMKARPAPLPPAPTWTGCYIDGGWGYGFWNQDQHTETFPGLVSTSFAETRDGGRGWLGRVGGGCDYQLTGAGFFSNFTIGAFGDYDWMDLKGTNNFHNIGVGGVFGPPAFAFEKESSAWYVGGRVGYVVFPSLLGFVSAGYTETHFNGQSFTFLNTGVPTGAFLPSATYRGWFVGGGEEYALNFLSLRGLFWKTEYRFAQYDSKDLVTFGPGATPGFAQHTAPTVQTITSSLVWRFNWTGGPVVARY
jgi:outer membrane immunogenic protein